MKVLSDENRGIVADEDSSDNEGASSKKKINI